MKPINKYKKYGFTLIELLIVVLIISILAAIALPQYELSIEKTRINSLLHLIRSIDSAQKLHFLNKNTYALNFDELDISMPDGGIVTNGSYIVYPKYSCRLRPAANGLPDNFSTYCITSSGISVEKYYNTPWFHCWADKTDERENKICKIVSGRNINSGSNTTGYSYRF